MGSCIYGGSFFFLFFFSQRVPTGLMNVGRVARSIGCPALKDNQKGRKETGRKECKKNKRITPKRPQSSNCGHEKNHKSYGEKSIRARGGGTNGKSGMDPALRVLTLPSYSIVCMETGRRWSQRHFCLIQFKSAQESRCRHAQ